MKTIIRSLLLILFLATGMQSILASADVSTELILNKKLHILTAPEAEEYIWYLNGEKISFDRSISIKSAGVYEVKMQLENGSIKSASMSLGIDEDGEIFTIWIIGDSTACNWASGYYPKTGWGQVLHHFFDDNVVVKNEALSGRSARSFYNDHWAPIRDALQPGDLVFIQFGINDAADDPARYSSPFTDFQDFLRKFVNESREKNALPVLLTTVRRNAWNATNPPTLYDAYHDYPVATRQLAPTLGVPLIDLDRLTIPLLEGLGPEYVGPFMYMILEPGEYPYYSSGQADQVHFQENGAIEMARLVIEDIEESAGDTVLNRLLPHIKPRYQVDVSTNFPDGAIISRSADFPEGIPVTIKAKLDPAYDLLEWQNGSAETVSTKDRYQFTMEASDLSFVAILDDDPIPDCQGVYNGPAYIDDCGKCVDGTTGLLPCDYDTGSGMYKLTSVRSDLCIQEGEIPSQEDCLKDSSQFWNFITDGKYYQIKNLASDQYLNFESLEEKSYAILSESPVLWRLERVAGDTFHIAPWGNPDLILEVYGTIRTGQQLRLYKRNGYANQQFRLWDMDLDECTGYPCTFSENSSTDLPELFHIFPNPITESATLYIDSRVEKELRLEVYNIQGARVFERKNITGDQYTFGEKLEPGIYLVKVGNGKVVRTLKLIKK